MKSERRGFTLIELLVVIAIIAILAAILFPVFSSAKESGRKVACLNNMMQLGKGFMMYNDVWNGYPGSAPVGASENSGQWIGQDGIQPNHRMVPQKGVIFPYVKNKNVYVCPSDKGGTTFGYRSRYYQAGFGDKGFGLSYGMNSELGFKICSAVPAPSKIVLLIDESSGSYDDTQVHFNRGHVTDAICDGNFGYKTDKPADSHIGGCNFTFCDGHAVWKDSKSYKNLKFLLKGTI
ncbi:MAG: DUF1559 domain-containing protein [Armatimonadota bacterium]|nr:DUF1559 domain-containing protein [bacterium]